MWTGGSTWRSEAVTEPVQSSGALGFDTLFFQPEWPTTAVCSVSGGLKDHRIPF